MNCDYACAGASALEAATRFGLPVVLAPIDSAFLPLDAAGQRLLLSADGLYLEVRTACLYARKRLAYCATPYGCCSETLELFHGPMPGDLLRACAALALEAHPREMAALILADPIHGYRLHRPDSNAHIGALHYDDTGYPDDALVVDVHSHGPYGAAFSTTDDASDRARGIPHISVVIGRCAERGTLAYAARLCAGPYLLQMTLPELKRLFA